MEDIRMYANKGRKESFSLLDTMVEMVGAQTLLEDLCRALSNDQVADNLSWLCQQYEIEDEIKTYLGIEDEE